MNQLLCQHKVFTVLGELVRHANGDKMPKRCVVAGCSNIGDKEKEISLHAISYSGDKRPEAKKRRKTWTDFVMLKPQTCKMDADVVCSEHFKPEDFCNDFPMSKVKAPLATDGSKGTRSEFAYYQQSCHQLTHRKFQTGTREWYANCLILYLYI